MRSSSSSENFGRDAAALPILMASPHCGSGAAPGSALTLTTIIEAVTRRRTTAPRLVDVLLWLIRVLLQGRRESPSHALTMRAEAPCGLQRTLNCRSTRGQFGRRLGGVELEAGERCAGGWLVRPARFARARKTRFPCLAAVAFGPFATFVPTNTPRSPAARIRECTPPRRGGSGRVQWIPPSHPCAAERTGRWLSAAGNWRHRCR